jgi:hypothetical protein
MFSRHSYFSLKWLAILCIFFCIICFTQIYLAWNVKVGISSHFNPHTVYDQHLERFNLFKSQTRWFMMLDPNHHFDVICKINDHLIHGSKLVTSSKWACKSFKRKYEIYEIVSDPSKYYSNTLTYGFFVRSSIKGWSFCFRI